jgi:uncharacterized protein (DUF2062 family)
MRDQHHRNTKGDELKFRRIRFVKKILRHVPRRASIHRYPFLNRFADAARKRPYLWSFRVSEVIPAFYLGWIITFMPILSVVQIVIAFFAALLCRANAMILVCLQLLSNPITFVFLWLMTYKVGAGVVKLLGIKNLEIVAMESSSVLDYGKATIRQLATIILGAIVLGTILGAISSTIYRYLAAKVQREKKH